MCNGSTRDFGSLSFGSNPDIPTIISTKSVPIYITRIFIYYTFGRYYFGTLTEWLGSGLQTMYSSLNLLCTSIKRKGNRNCKQG